MAFLTHCCNHENFLLNSQCLPIPFINITKTVQCFDKRSPASWNCENTIENPEPLFPEDVSRVEIPAKLSQASSKHPWNTMFSWARSRWGKWTKHPLNSNELHYDAFKLASLSFICNNLPIPLKTKRVTQKSGTNVGDITPKIWTPDLERKKIMIIITEDIP